MSFEEEFPSLEKLQGWFKYEEEKMLLQRHCLDKQRVREAWEKAKAEWKKELEDEYGAPQHDNAWDEFEEELGL